MTPAEREALIVRAKQIATPVVSCVRADLRFDHLAGGLSREELLALVTVLAEAASLDRLKALTGTPGDGGLAPLSREDVLRRAHAEYARLTRAGLPVPYRIRLLDNEYRRGNKQRRAGAAEDAAGRRDAA